jgi:hypothetical protein
MFRLLRSGVVTVSQSSFESRRDDARRSLEEQEVREALLFHRSPSLEDDEDEVVETSA